MSMQQVQRQMPASAGRVAVAGGEAVRATISDEACGPRHGFGNSGSALLLAALTRENLQQAFKRVRANKGAAGVDGLDINETAQHLVTAWPAIREQLLSGMYRPSPVRRVTIPKPDGGERELGIPTVTDRLIQQALLQVLQPILDPTFSQYSFGFRPRRCAQHAVRVARSYVQSGRRVVVDVDLEKFFDRVSHDILIDRLQKRIDDAGVIRLIRAYLNSGIMSDGVVQARHQGTPQDRKGLPHEIQAHFVLLFHVKAGPYRRFWPTCCSMKWTRNWSDAVIALFAMPMMRMYMFGVIEQVSE